jgi:hypothetical protein
LNKLRGLNRRSQPETAVRASTSLRRGGVIVRLAMTSLPDFLKSREGTHMRQRKPSTAEAAPHDGKGTNSVAVRAGGKMNAFDDQDIPEEHRNEFE